MDELSETLRAVADPSRRRQLTRLSAGVATSGQLAQVLSMSRPAGSQHLAVLIRAGLVETTAVGRERRHHLDTAPLYRARAWLDELLSSWEEAAAPPDSGAAATPLR